MGYDKGMLAVSQMRSVISEEAYFLGSGLRDSGQFLSCCIDSELCLVALSCVAFVDGCLFYLLDWLVCAYNRVAATDSVFTCVFLGTPRE